LAALIQGNPVNMNGVLMDSWAITIQRAVRQTTDHGLLLSVWDFHQNTLREDGEW
jgi:6-pyruvoyl-tetrahydropterin synthase